MEAPTFSTTDRRMADVVLSYAHEDTMRVRTLRDVLSQHFSVWWDEEITVGDYRIQIEAELLRARCVIPIWSAASRKSDHVIDETEIAMTGGTPVLPVRIEAVAPPLGFGRLHMIDLVGWQGEVTDERIMTLVERIRRLCAPVEPNRPERIRIGARDIACPAFVFSASSHETQIPPQTAVQALSIWIPAAMLVSAYDLANADDATPVHEGLRTCMDSGTVVLLDSGNYEAYRKADTSWTPERYHRVLESAPYDAAFHFDNTNPPSDWQSAVADVLGAFQRDSEHASSPLIPILHSSRTANGFAPIENLAQMVLAIADELRPALIAVPERELGDGLIARARSVHSLRSALNGLRFYQPLHLLGTGNHFSAAVFAAAGADSFDGLEWCRTVADHETGSLYHFQHYDMVAWQSAVSDTRLVRDVSQDDSVPYGAKAAFHNLDFFDRFFSGLRTAIWTGRVDRFLTGRLPGGYRMMEQLEAQLPEVFS